MAVSLSKADAAVVFGVGADTTNFKQEIGKLGDETKKALGSMNSNLADSFDKVSQSLGKIGKVMTASVTLPLLAIGTAALKTSVDFVKLYESTMIVFEKMLGGRDAAQGLYNDLLDIAKASTYSQETFLRAGKTLVGMGVDASTTTKIMQACTDAVAGFGGTSEDIENLAGTFATMSNNGRLSMLEIKSLSANGVQALKILGNQYGITTDEMREMISSGAVPAGEAIELLTSGILEGTDGVNGYTNAMAGMAESLKAGSLTGALDSINSAIRSFSLSLIGINPTLKETDAGYAESQKRIEQLTAAITTISEIIPLLAKVFSGVTDAIGKVLDKLVGTNVTLDKSTSSWKNVNGALGQFKNYLERTPTSQLKRIGNLIAAIAVAGPGLLVASKAFQVLSTAIKGVQVVTTIATGAMKAYRASVMMVSTMTAAQTTVTGLLTAAQYVLNAAMKANPAGVIITAIVALVAAMFALKKVYDKFFPSQANLTHKSKEQAQRVSELRDEYEHLAETQGESSEAALKAKAALEEEELAFESSKQTLREFNDECKGVIETYDEMIAEIRDSNAAVESETGRLLNLIDKYEELSQKTGRTIEDKAELAVVCSNLTDAVDDLNISYDATTDTVEGNVDAIESLTRAEINRLKAVTYIESYNEALEAQKLAVNQLDEAEEQLANTNIDLWTMSLGFFGFLATTGKDVKDITDNVDGLRERVEEAGNAVEGAEQQMKDWVDEQYRLGEALREVQGDLLTAEEAAEKYGVELEVLNQMIEDEAIEAQKELEAEIEAVNEQIEQTIEELQELCEGYYGLQEALEDSGGSLENLAEYMVDASISTDDLKGHIETFADSALEGFTRIEGKSKVTATELKNNLKANTETTEKWAENIATLYDQAGEGAETNFVRWLESLGVENASIAEELLSDTGESLESMAATWEKGSKACVDYGLEQIGYFPEGVAETMEETTGVLGEGGEAGGQEYGDRFTETASESIRNGKEEIQAAADEAFSGVDVSLDNVTERAKEAGIKVGQNVAEGISETKGQITSAMTAIDGIIGKAIKTLTEATEKGGENIITSLAKGIKAQQPQVQTNVSAISKAIIKTFTDTKLLPVGRSMISELAKGIESGISLTTAATKKLSESIIKALKNTVSQAYTIGLQIAQGAANGIRSGNSSVASAMSSVARSAVEAAKKELDVNSPSRVMYKVFGSVIEGAVNALNDGERDITGTMTSILKDTLGVTEKGIQRISDAMTLKGIDISGFGFNFANMDALAASFTFNNGEAEIVTELRGMRRELSDLKEGLGKTISDSVPNHFETDIDGRVWLRLNRKYS